MGAGPRLLPHHSPIGPLLRSGVRTFGPCMPKNVRQVVNEIRLRNQPK